MFCFRNATGSIPAAYASSSTICSEANSACGAAGARRYATLGSPESFAIDRPMMRWLAIAYCEPAFSVSAPPKPPSDSGRPDM